MEEVNLEERIVDAAYYCFDKYGFDKTTIGDISDKASVARSTFYKFFKNKDAVILDICLRETVNEALEVDRVLAAHQNREEALVEIVSLVIRVAQENHYIRYMLESDEALKVVATYYRQESSHAATMLKNSWQNALAPFIDNNKFGQISLDEAISWINFCLIVLLRKADLLGLTDDQLRHFIRRFVLRPVFAGGTND